MEALDENAPLVLDALAFIHLARGDSYGEHLDATYRIRGRESAPIICSVTVGEVQRIAKRLMPVEQYEILGMAAVESLSSELAVQPVTPGITRAYGKLMAMLDDGGSRLRDSLGWVAATAHVHGAILITHNPDFKRLAGHVDCRIEDRVPHFAPRQRSA